MINGGGFARSVAEPPGANMEERDASVKKLDVEDGACVSMDMLDPNVESVEEAVSACITE